MDESILTCPRCGSPLTPVTYQEGLYSCVFCGEVEADDDGFIVNGEFYRCDSENEALDKLEDDDPLNTEPAKELTFGDVFGAADEDPDELEAYNLDLEADADSFWDEALSGDGDPGKPYGGT